ncbi:hypothetical protein M495_14500 [Serratia liquefaciens ATCC 27592]|uniref:hypothetical protein n=1 Tax=Serratia liquefaciens TaxID=614 RepID=UPI000358592E|nr:hypothetical protein [Serratia liquefaciens]AGQ31627.1 hypothetical protein M495_14500 [Serratia liquefaciens ATCC 27592]
MDSRKSELPERILITLMFDLRFNKCLKECLATEELVTNFCRLYEVEMPRQPRNPIEAMIDKSTGYAEDSWRKFFAVFIPFVYDCVYTRVCENPILPEVNHG